MSEEIKKIYTCEIRAVANGYMVFLSGFGPAYERNEMYSNTDEIFVFNTKSELYRFFDERLK